MVIGIHTGVPWLLPMVMGSVGIAWFIPIIAGLAASYLANRNKGGGMNQGSHSAVDPGVPPIGPQGDLIFEQGSPYWPGSQPTFPSNAFGQQQGGGGGGGSNSYSTTTQTVDMSTFPFITPEYANLGNLVKGKAEGLLNQPNALPRGYQANGIANINDIFDIANQSTGNRLVGAGLQGPIEASAYGNSDAQRAKALAGFQNDLPLKERELHNENLQLAATILEAFGKGQKQKGTTKTVTNASSSGGGGGGGSIPQTPLIGDALLQQYMNRGNQGSSGTDWFSKALGYASLIAGIYSGLKGRGGSTS